MRILIIMDGFFPGKKYGGPPVSIDNFCTLLSKDVDCYIVTQNHDMGDINPYKGISDGWNDRGNAKVKYLADKDYNSVMFEKTITEVQPNFIYLQGLFQDCILSCLTIAKKSQINVVLAPRGELCSGAFKKKYKKIPYILYLQYKGLLKNVIFQSTSDEETDAIKKYLWAKPERIHMLNNVPSIPQTLPNLNHKESGIGRFVFISRILWKKNLLKAILLLKDIKGRVYFDIYGPKEDERYWIECENVIRSLPSNISVEYKGIVDHDEIHNTFRKYDAFLFPTLSENYGHVIVEALLSGCIPIISDQTPWSDVNDAGAGWAISLNEYDSFIKAIQEVVDMDSITIAKRRGLIEAYLDGKLLLGQLKKDYLNVFKELV